MANRRLLVVPTGQGVGLTSVCLGIARALDRLGVRYGFCRPVSVRQGPDHSGELMQQILRLTPPDPVPREEAERLLGEGLDDLLLEEVVARVEQAGKDAAVVVVEGVVPVPHVAYATRLNVAMAKALDAELVLVGDAPDPDPVRAAERVALAARAYGAMPGKLSCILNRVHVPGVSDGPTLPGAGIAGDDLVSEAQRAPFRAAMADEGLHLLGFVPWLPSLNEPRVEDVARALGARTVHAGASGRRVARVAVGAASVRYATRAFQRGTLLVVPADRDDVLLGLSLATLEGVELAGVVLTCPIEPDPAVLDLIRPALETGLPVFATDAESYDTAAALHERRFELGPEDAPLADLATRVVANHLDGDWLRDLAGSARAPRMTTPAFRRRLIELAQAADKRIVLPEGDEPRTLQAAAICARRRIARCVLLGDPDQVRRAARRAGVDLPESVEIVAPSEALGPYVAPMVDLRRDKGLTADQAADQLADTVVLGTMMLAEGHVDGLVSGAVHSTAHTIRPALQLIRTAPGASLVSSVFFMCLPEQVLVYGDCAVNPDPTAEQLAEIALQCAQSAESFGIEPRVAMISYSTGTSGSGVDVDKVARATALARARRPDLAIDGPLQYDAAAIADVARTKAPDSPVAGRATVFVFPDLNTGNTVYKAVQRSAGVVSMGPMLQGLAKPVNDLSRGALVEDIVFTIALTAVQASRLG